MLSNSSGVGVLGVLPAAAASGTPGSRGRRLREVKQLAGSLDSDSSRLSQCTDLSTIDQSINGPLFLTSTLLSFHAVLSSVISV